MQNASRSGRNTEENNKQYSHSNKEGLFGCQTRRRILFHQGQSTEAKLMNGLIGIQRWEICVYLPIILSNMQAVGTDIVTERKTTQANEYCRKGHAAQMAWSPATTLTLLFSTLSLGYTKNPYLPIH